MSYAFANGTLIDRSHNNVVHGDAAIALEIDWLASSAVKLRQIARTQLHYSLQVLAARASNWDGRGSLAADGQSIFEALLLLESALEETIGLDLNWAAPHLGLDENGHVVMEWWNGRNKLTIYVAPGAPEFVCSWGQNVEQQMHSGALAEGGFSPLWRWLWTQPN